MLGMMEERGLLNQTVHALQCALTWDGCRLWDMTWMKVSNNAVHLLLINSLILNSLVWFLLTYGSQRVEMACHYAVADPDVVLRGEKLNYNNCTNLLLRKSQNLIFLAPEVQWASKFTVFVRFTFPLNFSNHAHIWYVTWPQ